VSRDKENEKRMKEGNAFEMHLGAIDLGLVQISAAVGNLRHRLGSEAAIYKAPLRRNQELEVEVDRLRAALVEKESAALKSRNSSPPSGEAEGEGEKA
jgi:hypothetical protein